MAAQAVTKTEWHAWQSCKSVMWEWKSSSGVVTSASTGTYDGDVIGLATIPDSTTAPTADYDITITDSDGFDVLLGAGIDRHTSNTEYVNRASLGGVSGSALTLNIANSGDAKYGVCRIWIR